MMTICLRADTEATLAAALPMLRADADGVPCWLAAGPLCDLDLIGPVVLTPAATDTETGEVTTPAVIDGRYHANVRGPRAGADSAAWAALLAALEPYRIAVATPCREFAP